MTKSLAKAWVKALRSGKFKQGIRVLRDKTDDIEGVNDPAVTYCCLGVLATVCRERKEFAQFDLNDDAITGESDLSDIGLLHPVGLAETDQSRLVNWNDGEVNMTTLKRVKQWSFKKIANWIERKFVTGPAAKKEKTK